MLRPGEAVPGAHLVPVPLVVDSGEDQDVQDQEAGQCHDDDDDNDDNNDDDDDEPGSDGDGDTEGGAVAAEAPLGQGEVALVVRRDHPLTNQR